MAVYRDPFVAGCNPVLPAHRAGIRDAPSTSFRIE
jgi:hypothetical protein